jgi:hypothetical protein
MSTDNERSSEERSAGSRTKPNPNTPLNTIDNYFLFAIAIDRYDKAQVPDPFARLQNPVRDTADVVACLLKDYKFYQPIKNEILPFDSLEYTENSAHFLAYNSLKTKCLYNEQATEINIIKHLIELKKVMGENDALLVYFAGHGDLGFDGKGKIIPFDANNDTATHWLGHETFYNLFDNFLTAKKCRHLLLVFDCCYAGAAAMGNSGVGKSGDFSRMVLTSTTEKATANDGIQGQNSPFAKAFLSVLAENKPYLTIEKSNLQKKMDLHLNGKSPQKLYYERLPAQEVGMGNFFFEARNVDKPQVKQLRDVFIQALNFDEQRGNLTNSFEAKRNFFNIISTCGQDFDEQKMLSKVMFNHLVDLKNLKALTTETHILDLDATQISDPWQALWAETLATSSFEQPKDENWKNKLIDYFLNRMLTEDIVGKNILLLFRLELGTPRFLEALVDFSQDFKKRFFEKKNQREALKTANWGHFFIVFSDQRPGRKNLFFDIFDEKALIDTNTDYNLIPTNPIAPLRQIHIDAWLKTALEQLQFEKIQTLKDMNLQFITPENQTLPISDFIAQIAAHCGFSSDEKLQLSEFLYGFNGSIV